jgi:hypothetical protein
MTPHPKILKEEWTPDNKCIKPFKCIVCSKLKPCMLVPDPMMMHNEPDAVKAGCVTVSAWCRPCYVSRDYMTLN